MFVRALSKFKPVRLLNNFNRKISFQYFSDPHVDLLEKNKLSSIISSIEPKSENLIIAGDLGNPEHENCNLFLKEVRPKFKNIFFVPGNHDFDCGPMMEENKVKKYEPIIKNLCLNNNITYLNNNIHEINKDVIIAGTTLWSLPIYHNRFTYDSTDSYRKHVVEYYKNVEWITAIRKMYNNKKIIMVTHFVPTFKLIEDKYAKLGLQKTSYFASDLDHLIKNPICAWICGHTHSKMNISINNIYCGINVPPSIKDDATLSKNKITTKVFYVID
ncbi:MAG: metallophosphatase [Edafosvirus sp.]|uniref:Metallophosphatase n=1 Tax=Edafosvirus sp. TaxID=2487765 RepID=A0A3G4ZV13_9VIRU|nr:MAG: metallophosphatase [Edafosvirus sp.]